MNEANWFYKGRQPQAKQYEVMPNIPQQKYQYVKIMDMVSQYDSTYYQKRTFVSIGRGCTEEEAALTPRFCGKVAVANEPNVVTDLLKGAVSVGSSVVDGLGKALEAASGKNSTPSNTAVSERMTAWFGAMAKLSEKAFKS